MSLSKLSLGTELFHEVPVLKKDCYIGNMTGWCLAACIRPLEIQFLTCEGILKASENFPAQVLDKLLKKGLYARKPVQSRTKDYIMLQLHPTKVSPGWQKYMNQIIEHKTVGVLRPAGNKSVMYVIPRVVLDQLAAANPVYYALKVDVVSDTDELCPYAVLIRNTEQDFLTRFAETSLTAGLGSPIAQLSVHMSDSEETDPLSPLERIKKLMSNLQQVKRSITSFNLTSSTTLINCLEREINCELSSSSNKSIREMHGKLSNLYGMTLRQEGDEQGTEEVKKAPDNTYVIMDSVGEVEHTEQAVVLEQEGNRNAQGVKNLAADLQEVDRKNITMISTQNGAADELSITNGMKYKSGGDQAVRGSASPSFHNVIIEEGTKYGHSYKSDSAAKSTNVSGSSESLTTVDEDMNCSDGNPLHTNEKSSEDRQTMGEEQKVEGGPTKSASSDTRQVKSAPGPGPYEDVDSSSSEGEASSEDLHDESSNDTKLPKGYTPKKLEPVKKANKKQSEKRRSSSFSSSSSSSRSERHTRAIADDKRSSSKKRFRPLRYSRSRSTSLSRSRSRSPPRRPPSHFDSDNSATPQKRYLKHRPRNLSRSPLRVKVGYESESPTRSRSPIDRRPAMRGRGVQRGFRYHYEWSNRLPYHRDSPPRRFHERPDDRGFVLPPEGRSPPGDNRPRGVDHLVNLPLHVYFQELAKTIRDLQFDLVSTGPKGISHKKMLIVSALTTTERRMDNIHSGNEMLQNMLSSDVIQWLTSARIVLKTILDFSLGNLRLSDQRTYRRLIKHMFTLESEMLDVGKINDSVLPVSDLQDMIQNVHKFCRNGVTMIKRRRDGMF